MFSGIFACWTTNHHVVLFRLHDRKLSVLGLCSLLSMTNTRPQEVTAAAEEVLPAMLILFQGLKRAYASMYAASVQ